MARNAKTERQNAATATETNGSGDPLKEKKNRRDLLKLGGAAAVGAVGGLALQPLTASAADGSPLVIGVTNDGSGAPPTQLIPTAATTPAEMLRIIAAGQPNTAIGNGALQVRGINNGEGIDASCNGPSGRGVKGFTDAGHGVLGQASAGGVGIVGASPAGVDMAAAGSGRLWQFPNPGVTGSGPAYAPNLHEQVRDANGVLWIDGVGQNPNKWAPVQPGASFIGAPGTSIFTTTSNSQHTLSNSDGSTWVNMDTVSLRLTITAPFNALAILSANSSLFTDTAGYNQDIAIFVNNGIHSWQESGGFAGTFSPNAAFVHGVYGSFFRGTVYTVEIRWKTNKPAPGVTIYSGAGTASSGFSPTRLTVQLVILS